MRLLAVLFLFITSIAFGQGLLTASQPSGAKTPDIYVYYVDDQPIGSGLNQANYVETTGAFWAHPNNISTSIGAFNNTLSWSNVVNDFVTILFRGYQVEVLLEKYPNHGFAAISIDGGTEVLVDTYAADRVPQWLAWDSRQSGSPYTALTNGYHTLKIRVNHTKNASATDYYVVFDAARIHTNTQTLPPTPDPPVDSEHRIYVAKTGNDGTGTGATGAPYLTIGKAASVADPGDTIRIRTGTYRETVTPPSGIPGLPIVFMSDDDGVDQALISGLEDVGSSGWTVHSGNIYKKTITLPVSGNFASTISSNTTLLANQIFKDGVMQPLAGYPDFGPPEDYLDKTKMRTKAQTSAWSSTSLTDSGIGSLSLATNSLSGAQLFKNGWFMSETRSISANSGSSITFSSGTINGGSWDKFYYICNALALLNTAKEWYYNSNTLYYWQTGGGSPTGLEYKARNWGFNLKGKSYVQIIGINFNGCEPFAGDNFTTNCLLDYANVTYQNHAFLTPNSSPDYFYNARQVGLISGGSNNIIRNSEFRYGIQGVWAGANTKVLNCYFYNYGYDGTYAAPISFLNGANGVEIGNNTITKVGRSDIHMGAYAVGNQTAYTYLNLNIHHNDMSYHSMLLTDNGAIYANIRTNLTGTVIHHNWMHHNAVSRVGGVDGVQVTGVYLDQASGPVTMHHNVTHTGDECDFYAEQYAGVDNGWSPPAPARTVIHYHYNETWAGTTDRTYISYSGIADIIKNCIRRGSISGTVTETNSLSNSTNPLFTGGSLSTPATYFSLQSGSPARGIGAAISGINDDDTPPRDAGAYPYGEASWTAGYTSSTYTPIP